MNKKRFLSAVLAVLMVLVSVPLDTIKVMAGIDGNAGLEYEYDSTNNTASVAGYAADSASTVKRIIIPETVTKDGTTYTVKSISAGALNSTKLPKLQEVAVLGDSVEIGENAFGKYQDGTIDGKVAVWCNAGSSAEAYASSAGLARNYLNVQDLEINSPNSTYYTGCEPFEISTVIKAKSSDVRSTDIIWKTSNSELASFRDEEGNVLTEAQGTLTDNDDGTTTVKIKVYVCDNTVRKSGSVDITATCRGTGNQTFKTYSIKKATTTITPDIAVYSPTYVQDDNGNQLLKVDENNRIVYDEVPLSELQENGYYINDTLYIDAGYGYVIDGKVDADSDDYCAITTSTDGNTNLVVGQTLNNTSKGNGTDVLITGVADSEGNEINEDILFAKGTAISNSTLTLFSQNKILSKKIEIKVCQPAKDLQMYMGANPVAEYGSYTGLVQTTFTLRAELNPDNSTDTVEWTSSDENVAKINDGNKLYLNSPGTSTVTCTVKDSRSGKRHLKKSFTIIPLAKVQYKEIVFAEDEERKDVITEKFIPVGGSYLPIVCDARDGEIYIAGNDETAANEPLTFTSSNESVATVENGVVKALAPGIARITVRAESGISNSISIKVYTPASDINISTAITIPEGQTLDYAYSLVPVTATEDMTWTSESTAIASCEDYIDDNGNRFLRLTGVKTGTITLIGRTVQSGTQVRVNVTVAPAVHADSLSIQLDGNNAYISTDEDGSLVYNIPKGETMYLKPVLKSSTGVTPNDQTTWLVEASQQNCSITCQDDKTLEVTASNAGRTYVTLKAYGGSYEKSIKCYINVYVPAQSVDILIDGTSASECMIELGTTRTIRGYLFPDDSTDSIEWSTDNDNIILTQNTSAQNGSIAMTANKVGTTILKAQASSGVSDTVIVRVIRKAKEVRFVQDGEEVETANIPLNGEKTISLNVFDEDTTDTTFTWSNVVDNGLLKITPGEDGKSAVIKGLARGTQQIVVTAPSGFQAYLMVNVVSPATGIELNSTEMSIYKGDPEVSVEALLSPSSTNDVVSWRVDKNDIISITPDSVNSNDTKKVIKIKGIGEGTVNLTATTVNNISATIKINVIAKDIGSVSVSEIPAYTYTGKEIIPSFVVINNNTELVFNTDYTVQYSNNINAGNGTITIEGKGNYAGTKTVTFEILPKNIANVQYNLVKELVYNGKTQIPDIEVTDSETGTAVNLVNGKDYTVEYSDNTNAGACYAKYTGIGNYSGEYTGIVYIQQKDISTSDDIVISPISSKTFTGNEISPAVTVKYGDTVLKKDTDYTLSFSNNVYVGKATVTVYGMGNFVNSKSITFTINSRSLSKAKVTAIPNMTYTGKSLKPDVYVSIGGVGLSLGTDYKVSYSNNKKPGKATVKITGLGNYKSSISKSFVILPLYPKNPKMSSNTYNTVTLKWSKATGATGYYVYAYKESKGKYYKVATTTKNTVKIKKLSAGTDYTLQIYSYVKVGSKTYKSIEPVTLIAGTKTKTPSIRKITTAYSSATLTWKNVAGAYGYSVYYATSKKGKYRKFTDVSGNSIDVTNLKAKRTYFFKIRAYRSINGKTYYSSYSSIRSIKIKK